MTAVYLERHPPASPQYRATRRTKTLPHKPAGRPVSGAIVVHTAENRPDLTLPDDGAENVAAFIARRTDPGSYHTVVDSDGPVHVGRYTWEMFGEGTGGNRWALHLSFACQAHQWPTLPADWTARTIRHGATEAAQMAHWCHTAHGITVPTRRITKAEYHAGRPGFITHADLDPNRRTDPGREFPWSMFLARTETELAALMAPTTEHPIAQIRRMLNANGVQPPLPITPDADARLVAALDEVLRWLNHQFTMATGELQKLTQAVTDTEALNTTARQTIAMYRAQLEVAEAELADLSDTPAEQLLDTIRPHLQAIADQTAPYYAARAPE